MKDDSPDSLASYQIPQRFLPQAGEVIDNYRIIKILGEGTFGIVYKVEEVTSGDVFALKLLKLWSIAYEEERRLVLQRFDLEYKTGLIESDYLVCSRGCGRAKGNPYILMEFCPGGDLRKAGDSGLSAERLYRAGIEILLGLRDLHDNGKIHRDLKPDNVLLDEKGRAKLTDFGISGHKNVRMTKRNLFGQPQEVFGTYAYMPPEQLKPRDATKLPATDIYSFGVLIFELLTGKLPFGPLKTESDLGEYVSRVNTSRWDDIRTLRPDIDHSWARVIEKCLQPDYRKRYASVLEILNDLGVEPGADLPEPEPGKTDFALQVKQGEDSGRIYNLEELKRSKGTARFLVGRNDEEEAIFNDVDIRETPPDGKNYYISRKQATIEHDPSTGRWYLRDGQWAREERTWKNSLNGSFVNSYRAGEEGYPLNPGDIITLGETTLKVTFV